MVGTVGNPIQAEVIFSQDNVYSISVTIFLEETTDFAVATCEAISPSSIVAGSSTSSRPRSIDVTASVPDINKVNTTTVPTIIIPQSPFLPQNSDPIAPSVVSLEEINQISDAEIIPVMKELHKIRNNVTSLPVDSKDVWSQTIVENITSPEVGRTVVKILTSNYSTFTQPGKDKSGRVQVVRKRF